MIYVDDMRACVPNENWKWKENCHLFMEPSDDLAELHKFAKKLGMKKAWFQGGSSIPHYDLINTKRTTAVKRGAIEVDHRETACFIGLWREHRVFSLTCRDCDAGMDIGGAKQAEKEGWSGVKREEEPLGDEWWTHMGLCPDCKKEDDVANFKP